MSASIVRKISTGTVLGKSGTIRGLAEQGAGEDGNHTPVGIMRVLGTVQGIKAGESNSGTWHRFDGMFEATRLHDGEVFKAGACFLPPVAEELIRGAFDGEPLSFAFDVMVTLDESSSVGYVYGVRNLLPEEEASDPLRALKDALPALPAPLAIAAETAKKANGSKRRSK